MNATEPIHTDAPLVSPLANNDMHDFIMGGHAIFTALSMKTGAKFTYKIRTPDDEDSVGDIKPPTIWFVSVLTGPDNWSNYKYLGHIKHGQYTHGAKSKIGPKAPSAVTFAWLFPHLMHGTMPAAVEIWHSGKCGRCSRRLTDPISVACGIGPVCRGKAASSY